MIRTGRGRLRAFGAACALGMVLGVPAFAEDTRQPVMPPLAFAQAETASEAGAAELKALTDQVLKSLNAISPPPAREKETAPVAPQDHEALFQALTTLVEKATRQGKTSDDILALIEEALADQDEATLMALIERAGGRMELQKLLRALVHKAALETRTDDPYTRMLRAEGEATSIADTPRAPARAPVAGAARTIRVQPGDTLGTLALQYLGSARRWRDLYEANRDILKNPDLVPAGIRLRLP